MSFIDCNESMEKEVPPPFHRRISVIFAPDLDPNVKKFTLLISTLEPDGGCTPMHAHLEGELMYFISGRGRAVMDDGTQYKIKPNTALWAPAGVKHQTINDGSEPLRIVCVFIPAVSASYIQEAIKVSLSSKE